MWGRAEDALVDAGGADDAVEVGAEDPDGMDDVAGFRAGAPGDDETLSCCG